MNSLAHSSVTNIFIETTKIACDSRLLSLSSGDSSLYDRILRPSTTAGGRHATGESTERSRFQCSSSARRRRWHQRRIWGSRPGRRLADSRLGNVQRGPLHNDPTAVETIYRTIQDRIRELDEWALQDLNRRETVRSLRSRLRLSGFKPLTQFTPHFVRRENMGAAGFEPATAWSEAKYSVQTELSARRMRYRRVAVKSRGRRVSHALSCGLRE